ncbi:PREDICTED: ATP-dependent RNA helicase DEAH11, chloroplastic-like [Ipomoea nil]|uniref:ATP-dependent RNA helicase DEAH11, chloroplastic-like n=1 Tax=Ipomoea nil TaxID=35883 RepID=UPI000900EA9B|nr:PREDICTED: ATP-dependent RNA helicase DEAH11, chloroplastic-like [Ipomoea nil]
MHRPGVLDTARRNRPPEKLYYTESGHCYRPRQPYQHQWNSQFSNRRDRFPGPPKTQQKFVIQFRSSSRTLKRSELDELIEKLPSPPQSSYVFDSGSVLGTLFYEQWSEAVEVVVKLWRIRLDGGLPVAPSLVENAEVSSKKEELKDRLRGVFLEKLEGLMEGELVQKCRQKLELLEAEIKKVSKLLGRPKRIALANELLNKKEAFVAEKDLIAKRIAELKNGVSCIVLQLEGKYSGEDVHGDSTALFNFETEFNWDRILHLIKRECRRLEDGLPIFAFREEILKQIDSQQVTVLIGETGSGKSTQLVQFLADSGIAGNGAVVCTQPRKLAAISLADRVKEESVGCYKEKSIACYPSYSSIHQFESKVTFMTDHCLLQHYLRDKSLCKISCIIIDEAHERSLNTDLLLALLRNLLHERHDLRLIIMSATADADQLTDYFFGCRTFYVSGRTFPVDIKYVPSECEGSFVSGSGMVPSYVSDVVSTVTDIHKAEGEGTILAFLTSQMEVEWAIETFQAPSAIALPLHGKLSYEDQHRVFLNFPGKRKVIFTTNVAETSLTIPGVKYVVDSGRVKESRFEPGTGMNVLKVCPVSKSSANQRAGRAGRTEPGRCYRLYSKNDFENMPCHKEPEIRRVHLGIAVLRILALGIKDVQSFDFVDAPSPKAIEMAIRNLIYLGAIACIDDGYELTADGHYLVKLGIEPRLGKIILSCFHHHLGKEGLVLAAVMANSNSIFCRVGTEVDKLKSDCLKVQFSHPDGDLFTLLSVYKEWDAVPQEKKNAWCWNNSINAKTMRRCQETVEELEACLQNELSIVVPTYWHWDPHMHTEHDETLKHIILSSLSENVAMFSGYDQLGYEVALTGKHVKLHPSCSLLNFCQRPTWVVFGDILASVKEYLVCVTAFDFNNLATSFPPSLFDFSKMDAQKLQKKTLTGFGSMLLKRLCGKSNCHINRFVSRMRTLCMDERIGIEVNVDQNEIAMYASSRDMERVFENLNEAVEYEYKLLKNECLEKCLYNRGSAYSVPTALFGAGAEIKHLELEKRCLTVDVFLSKGNSFDDKELLMFLERNAGDICVVHRSSGVGQDSGEMERWGRVTFVTPNAAKRASALNSGPLSGGMVKVVPSKTMYDGDQNMISSHLLKAKVRWPRRSSTGVAIVTCHPKDIAIMVDDFSSVLIGGNRVQCEPSIKYPDNIVITELDSELSEAEICEVLTPVTDRKILDLFLLRGNSVEGPPLVACEEALLREISFFMPKRNPYGNSTRVQVFHPGPTDYYMKAAITFDGSLYLEAARALEEMNGKVLPGCLSWQKIECQQLFSSSVSCLAAVYHVIKNQLDTLLASFRHRKGVECNLRRNENGSYRVTISAGATKLVAEVRKPFEQLMKGKIIDHGGITPTVLQHLFSREGIFLMKSIQQETGTYILFDRHTHTLRIFGSSNKIDMAEKKFVDLLLSLHESKQLEVHLRGEALPPNLMKRVVQRFGADLNGIKQMFPEGNFSLNVKQHCISISGPKEVKQKVEDVIYEMAQASSLQKQRSDDETDCPICLCEVEESFKLENCFHDFCRSCLVEQCESAIRSREGFPMCCMHKGCKAPILIADLKSLLSIEKLEELFRASLGAFVAASGGSYRFCPSPDCPSVYRAADPGTTGEPFICGACYAETCTSCHLEYHPFISCVKYREIKDDPDYNSLKAWKKGKENVKNCPDCSLTIEKVDGCNHIECKCGKHVCWVCLEFFATSDDCYDHLRSVHATIT